MSMVHEIEQYEKRLRLLGDLKNDDRLEVWMSRNIAELFNVTQTTASRWMKSGSLSSITVRTPGVGRYIPRSVLIQWLEKQEAVASRKATGE